MDFFYRPFRHSPYSCTAQRDEKYASCLNLPIHEWLTYLTRPKKSGVVKIGGYDSPICFGISKVEFKVEFFAKFPVLWTFSTALFATHRTPVRLNVTKSTLLA